MYLHKVMFSLKESCFSGVLFSSCNSCQHEISLHASEPPHDKECSAMWNSTCDKIGT